MEQPIVPDDLAEQAQSGALHTALTTGVIGREIRHVAQTGSTNEDLKALARTGAAEGLLLSADEQTQGRGRRGRTWSAPPGSSLLTSTLLRPTWLPPSEGFYLTMLAAVAGAEAVEEATALRVDLKWPNDLEIAGRKLGGILVEAEITSGQLAWAVVGIGLNVNWDPATDGELAATATSLAMALGAPVSRVHLLRHLIARLDDRYTRLRSGQRQRLFDDWRSRLATVGQPVRAETAGTLVEGVAEGVTTSGALVVRDAAGAEHELTAGDVTVRRTQTHAE